METSGRHLKFRILLYVNRCFTSAHKSLDFHARSLKFWRFPPMTWYTKHPKSSGSHRPLVRPSRRGGGSWRLKGLEIWRKSLRINCVEQTTDSQSGANATGAGNADNAAVTEDTFTPSTQNNFTQATAQDAGLFQVSPGALTAVTARLPVCTCNAKAGTQADGRTTVIGNAKAENTQPAAATNFVTPVNPGQLFPRSPRGKTAP